MSQLAVDAGDEAIEAEALFNQVYVDKMLLLARIRQALQTRPQISLADLVASFPIEKGLAELVAYLSIAAEDDTAAIDDHAKQTLEWTDESGMRRQATLPLVIFSRLRRSA